MKRPVIVVTGGIASGKSTVAEVISRRKGAVVDCDRLAHRALDLEEVRDELEREFGNRIFGQKGRISRARLGEIVFSGHQKLVRLDRIIRPAVTEIIEDEVSRLKECYKYLVLDAVLFFQYKFNFEVELVLVTRASEEERVRRLRERNGMSREEAERRVYSQRDYYDSWEQADIIINTGLPGEKVKEIAACVRDGFLSRYYDQMKE